MLTLWGRITFVHSYPKTAHKDYGCRIVGESLYCDLVYNVLHSILTDGEQVLPYGL